MGFLAILSLLLGWDIKLDSESKLEKGIGQRTDEKPPNNQWP
jgi:hypothetical protein